MYLRIYYDIVHRVYKKRSVKKEKMQLATNMCTNHQSAPNIADREAVQTKHTRSHEL